MPTKNNTCLNCPDVKLILQEDEENNRNVVGYFCTILGRKVKLRDKSDCPVREWDWEGHA